MLQPKLMKMTIDYSNSYMRYMPGTVDHGEGSPASDIVNINPPHQPDGPLLPERHRIQCLLALQKLEPADLVHFINVNKRLHDYQNMTTKNGISSVLCSLPFGQRCQNHFKILPGGQP